jgi:phospholipid/cholesterol/gamma-HCH transport system ATP-binding protein
MNTLNASMAPDGDVIVGIDKLWTQFGPPEHPVVIHKDLDLSVRRGEIVSLVGGSGSGKTTLLRQILGLETPARGTVCVLGEPASQMGGHDASSRVGMLFQKGALFSAFSVLDNVAFALRELGTLPDALIRDAALVKLQMVGLSAQDATKMPSDLSGGMIKRVALARALIMDRRCFCSTSPPRGWTPRVRTAFAPCWP